MSRGTEPTQHPPALLTGLGVVCSLGSGRSAFVEGLHHGRGGIRRLTLLPPDTFASPWAGEVPLAPGQELQALGPTSERLEDLGIRLTRTERLCLVAAVEAVQDADLTPDELATAALMIASGGGSELLSPAAGNSEPGTSIQRLAARLVLQQPANAGAVVAHWLGIRGSRTSVMTACSSSALAVGLGLDLIRLGRAHLVLVAGCEALTELTFGGFSALKAMAPAPCRPFHAERQGLTLGEAAVVMVIESAAFARRRGRGSRAADCYAEVAGYGVSCDAHHLTSPAPDGRGALASMRSALADARVSTAEVGYVNAHGTGTPLNDSIEGASIRALFGDRAIRVPISSTKAATGHTLAAAGALELAVCAVAIKHGFLPATLGLDRPAPDLADLDHVVTPRHKAVHVTLSNSFAFGGHNVSVVLTRPRCY